MLIRKDRSGSDSFGHEWPEADDVVEVDADEAQQLLAIKDGGFSVVEPDPEPEQPYVVNPDAGPQATAPDLQVLAVAEQPPAADGTATPELVEAPVAPEQPVTEAPAPTRRGPGRPRKN